jgi:hypothetical protein
MKTHEFRFGFLMSGAALIAAIIFASGLLPAAEHFPEGCTVIGVGRLASADGSVITSHTDCCSECRIQVVPGRTYRKAL